MNSRLRHDLMTPLNQIIGYGEMLIEDAGEQEALRADLGRILSAAGNLKAALERLFEEQPSGETPAAEVRTDETPPCVELTAGDDHDPGGAAASPDRTILRPGRILIIDDDAGNQDMLSRQLGRQGYIPEIAGDGTAGLARLRQGNIDLVLLDVMMPGFDGYRVLRMIKEDVRLRAIPVIMISAISELDSVVRCIELGAEDYLPKPFNPTLLKARVAASLEKAYLREQERELREQSIRAEACMDRHRSLAEMVAGVAHEINTPLGIASTAQSVIESRLNSAEVVQLFESSVATRAAWEDVREALSLSGKSIVRAHRLIDTFKKISVSQITEIKETVPLAEVLHESVELFQINARRAKLKIQIDTSRLEGDGLWFGFPGYLSQVIMNLLQNVERYAYPEGIGGEVKIDASERHGTDEDAYVIVLSDFGAGIEPGNLARIFDPFFTTGRGKGGTGLGLAIVQTMMVTILQGTIRIESTPGEGTRVFLEFPKRLRDPGQVQAG